MFYQQFIYCLIITGNRKYREQIDSDIVERIKEIETLEIKER